MYELAPALEREDLYEWGEPEGGSGPVEGEIEAARRRRRPARISRPRSVTRRRPVRLARRRLRRPVARRMPRRVVRRPTVYGKRRPVRAIRRYISAPYTTYRRLDLPSVSVRRRPAAILSRFFDGQFALRRQHIPQIRQIARYIVASWRAGRPVRTIRLVGHSDNRGSARCTRRMGMRRAGAVRRRLVAEINRLRPGLVGRMTILSQTSGGTRPIASNATLPGRAANRRVAILLSRV
jgi:outer membrane protein OmpA-like peptidoglycan-associated protein